MEGGGRGPGGGDGGRAGSFSGELQNAADGAGETGPVFAFDFELFAAGGGEAVEAGAAAELGDAPFGADDALVFEAVERGVKRALVDAEDVFGDADKANRWLREELGILAGKSPLETARTEAGARLVEQLLAKLDWGAAA